MARFANAGPALGGETGWPSLFWLAGLLEGEGSFLKPVPSNPGCPIISCRMTDLDVVEFVAAIFRTSVQANDKGPYKTEYATTVRGSRCVELMSLLRPMLGCRRQRAIDRALKRYSPPNYKLDFERAEEIRKRLDAGNTVASLAPQYGVSGRTIRAIRAHRMYATPSRFPWLPISRAIRGATAAGTGLSWAELYWLAGWLEAEGSFMCPPPSSPKNVRLSADTCDEDVIEEVGRLIGARPAPNRSARNEKWSPLWRIMVCGGRAVTIMQAIRPVMSERRTDQIEQALVSASKAGAVLGMTRAPRSGLWPTHSTGDR